MGLITLPKEPPAPSPRKARPPVSSVREAAALAIAEEWYVRGSTTPCPMPMRRVFRAAMVAMTWTSRDRPGFVDEGHVGEPFLLGQPRKLGYLLDSFVPAHADCEPHLRDKPPMS